MSNYSKPSAAVKAKTQEEVFIHEEGKAQPAEIIPFPDLSKIVEKPKAKEKKKVQLKGKYLYYKGKKIPILQFQKSGYDKLLGLLVKGIE
jgi:hypothetical protein